MRTVNRGSDWQHESGHAGPLSGCVDLRLTIYSGLLLVLLAVDAPASLCTGGGRNLGQAVLQHLGTFRGICLRVRRGHRSDGLGCRRRWGKRDHFGTRLGSSRRLWCIDGRESFKWVYPPIDEEGLLPPGALAQERSSFQPGSDVDRDGSLEVLLLAPFPIVTDALTGRLETYYLNPMSPWG